LVYEATHDLMHLLPLNELSPLKPAVTTAQRPSPEATHSSGVYCSHLGLHCSPTHSHSSLLRQMAVVVKRGQLGLHAAVALSHWQLSLALQPAAVRWAYLHCIWHAEALTLK